MKNEKRAAVLIVIVVAAAAFGTVLWINSKRSKQVQKTSQVAQTSFAGPEYVNNEIGFRLPYPEGFLLATTSETHSPQCRYNR